MLNWVLVILASGLKLIQNQSTFFVARALSGIFTGIATVTWPVYIAENSPTKYRGFLIGITEFMIVLGYLISNIFGIFVPIKDDDDFWINFDNKNPPWRLMVAIPGISAMINLLLLTFIFKKEILKEK